ncbi:integration host factor subunit alpha [Rickettsiella grylli]|uniref:Integration host factor subunit alpha n=1 Tax=Rickettsiella grylli TaxID=59196 RepID=A8PMN2_9COXI|nr:integration host factor subunit alpha [Rickettsiella grylli]EDP45909.1 integration host factor subunit alpha (IHF-alpha) [Rickettsiella grylli]
MTVLTKADLIHSLRQQESSLSRLVANKLVDAFFEQIMFALEQGESVKISGLGRFRRRLKKERPGRNPQTGVTTQVSSRNVVLFQASQKLKMKLKKQKFKNFM